MRSSQFFLTLIMMIAFAGSGLAVPSGKTIEYEGGIGGKVIFDGKIHADKGFQCTDCHPKVFPMKKEIKITMAKINEGKYCGACHNGQEAFKPSEQTNCQRCHH